MIGIVHLNPIVERWKVTGLSIHMRITVNGKELRFNGVRLIMYSMKLVSNKSISEYCYVIPMLSSPTAY